MAELARATAHLEPPMLVLDGAALEANAADLVRRGGGKPVRVATKSVRVRAIVEEALARPGFRGVMAYSLREALWLAGHGVTDILTGYPSADREGLARLASDPDLARCVVLMVDDPAHLDLVDAAVAPRDARRVAVRVCLDVDASLRLGPVHLGVRRSPLRTPAQVAGLAREVARRPGVEVVGVMFYEAQVAGLPDVGIGVRAVKARSMAELGRRRGAVVAAVTDALGRPPAVVNGGGTGSVQLTVADPAVTEVTAGSGLFVPTLFDRYRTFTPRPALFVVLPVVRRPAPRIATVFGGGYIASGPSGPSRLPTPVAPEGLRLLGTEGAGEVQSPVRGRSAASLQIGDRVWWRHAKAGEVCERFSEVHVVGDGGSVRTVPTYRGEGVAFGSRRIEGRLRNLAAGLSALPRECRAVAAAHAVGARATYWSAIARAEDVEVLVQAHDVPVDVPLERVADLAEQCMRVEEASHP
jgi:D-serine deaminase-like pyridoxal phosphate-dependent protein